jgi:anaerobic magnesium-protoporphyrin IX monomethyl ester cyclase
VRSAGQVSRTVTAELLLESLNLGGPRLRSPRSIALVIPPDPPLASCNRDAMGGMGVLTEKRVRPVYPPLDVIYAATALRSLGARVGVVDSLGRELDVDGVASLGSDVVAVRIAFPTLTTDLDWMARLKAAAPRTHLIAFGPPATPLAEQVLESAAVDAVALGEPEVSLVAAALCERLEDAPGLVTEGGAAGEAPLVATLDALPFPDWSVLPVGEYTIAEVVTGADAAFPVSASRGCPHGCRYCPYPVSQGRAIRSRSPGNVLDELEYLVDRWQATHVLFRDPCFGMQKDWVGALCEGIRARGLRLTWRCETRGELLGEGLLEAMAAAGLVAVNVGAESIDPHVLEELGRRPRLLEVADAVSRCRSLGIETHVFLMAGLPGETPESFNRTVQWVMDLHPTSVQILPLVLYPGTDLQRSADREGHAHWTEDDPRLRGRVLSPSWWGIDQARALEAARARIALSHADWVRSFGARANSTAPPTPTRGERLRSYLQAARIVVRRGELAAALEWLDAASDVDPEHETVLVERGKVRAAAGDKAGAEREFRRALAAVPGSTRARLHLATILAVQGRWADAMPLLEQLAGSADLLPARRAGVHHLLSVGYAQQGQSDLAQRHRREWLRMMTDTGHTWRMDG